MLEGNLPLSTFPFFTPRQPRPSLPPTPQPFLPRKRAILINIADKLPSSGTDRDTKKRAKTSRAHTSQASLPFRPCTDSHRATDGFLSVHAPKGRFAHARITAYIPTTSSNETARGKPARPKRRQRHKAFSWETKKDDITASPPTGKKEAALPHTAARSASFFFYCDGQSAHLARQVRACTLVFRIGEHHA